MIGGRGGQYENHVWRSKDGANWVSVSVSGGDFLRRSGHQVVVHDKAPQPFVYEVATVSVMAPDGRLIVNWDDALPLTVATLTATGGERQSAV